MRRWLRGGDEVSLHPSPPRHGFIYYYEVLKSEVFVVFAICMFSKVFLCRHTDVEATMDCPKERVSMRIWASLHGGFMYNNVPCI